MINESKRRNELLKHSSKQLYTKADSIHEQEPV